ncbi:MAG: hypothetical protein LLG06_16330 [Desulfobacteraceae bacterium]|nr:hypothetical protein [Desulfobacteraceae bacterium]
MNWKRFVFLMVVVSVAGAAGFFMTRSGKAAAPNLKIAVPDDSGGLVVGRILRGEQFRNAKRHRVFESVQVRDCCAAVFESSLASSEVDAAVMCPEAAARLIEKDRRFEIIGPCVLNSDVIVCRPGFAPKKIGVSQKRGYQTALVGALFGPGCRAEPMVPAALPYAYEKGAVDGVVIDAIRAKPLKGDRITASKTGRDTVTYVLVVGKEFKSSPLFEQFLKAWEKAVAELRDGSAMAREIESCCGSRWTESEIAQLRNTGIRFTVPQSGN